MFGKNISLKDFIPPIAGKILRRILKRNCSAVMSLAPFAHPVLKSFSQYNEDIILDSIFSGKDKGIYIDVGANDPVILSNTKRFYDKGWHGINIEPNPILFQKLSKERPRDINLNIGIGVVEAKMVFYEMSANTLSSFDRNAAIHGGKIHGAKLINQYEVQVKRLVDVWNEHLIGNKVDFMSVDVEGFDFKVLQSNNWQKNRPSAIMVEYNQSEGDFIKPYLDSNGYYLAYRNHTNGIYLDNSFSE
jgi:FkbM family methyltransferase